MMQSNEISRIASLIGDKARSAMLIALMEGRALTAGELAIRANISAQTASNHLAQLLKAQLVVCERAGRHRYYKLASEQVAQALEALGLLMPPSKTRVPRHGALDSTLCFARTCYDHMAGELGVKLAKALLDKKILLQTESGFEIAYEGELFFKKLDIDVHQLQKSKRCFAKPCLDWTEREHHLAGSLGKALLTYFLENRLVLRSKEKSRVIVLTTKGKQWLHDSLALQMEKK